MKRLLLEVKGGGTAPAEIPRSGMLAIGSDPDRAGFVLTGQGVDDVHCAIGRTKDGTFAIKDLGSEYGTFLNGEKIAQARLSVGDEILLGSVRLLVVDGSDAPQTAATKSKKETNPNPKPAAKRKPKSPAPEIPGYEVAHRLGHGAMGDVYLAVQKSLDREVALKVLSKKHEQDQAFIRSFQAEARSAAALNHPNIVTVHDVGEHEGVHYLTMEYMDRESLEVRVVKEGALPWPIVLEALKDAASGLVYAESRGLVHRDIKPANLMQNHTGTTKIADLGLATSITEEDAGDDGQKILGTPHFISPEQIRGEKADCRSDLYSLGSTAYRLLTGQTPFQGTNTREILRSKLRDEPKPVRVLAKDVPEGLVAIVDRLMQRDPADRYPSASALLREIERLQSGATEGAAQAKPQGGLGKKLALPIVGALVLVIGGAAIFGGGDDEPQREDPTPDGGTGLVEGDGNTAPPPLLGDVGDEDPMPTGPADDDVAEKLFETNAENALLRLNQRDLGPEERRDELRTLAKEFLGTTAATQAIEEADRIDQEIREAVAQRSERDSAVASILKALNDAANVDAEDLNPGTSLSAMAAVPGLDAFAADDGFKAEYGALQGRVLAAALVQFGAAESAMLKLQGAGDFEGLRAQLLLMIGRTELPAFEEGSAPTGAAEVVDYGVRWRARLDSLDSLAESFEVEQRIADKRAIGTELGAASGLVGELARLDFDAAVARFERLDTTLGSADARAWNAALGAKLRAATGALPILSNHWSSWRRTRVSDPRERRGALREVVSASATGIVLESGGGTEEIPWTAFGADTKALDLLFSKRLDREYTAEEAEAISAMMHFTALAECLQLAGEMFQPNSGAVFTESEAEALPMAFNAALEWATSPEERAAQRRDREASELLGRALFRASEGEWTTAVAGLERLLAEYPETWLVRLLSDGSTVNLPE